MIDPASFGQVVLLSTAISILTTIGTFGQHRTILHYTTAQAYQSYGALATAMGYAIILVFFGFFVLEWFQGSIPNAILLVALLAIFHSLLSTQRRAFEDVKNFAFLRASLSICRLVLVVGTLLTFHDVSAYIAAEAVAIVLSLTFSARIVLSIGTESKDVSLARLIKSGKIGAPLLIRAILVMTITHYDKLLLARVGQYDQLGQYGMLYMIAASVSFVAAFIGIKYEPEIYQSGSDRSAFAAANNYQKRLLLTQGILAVSVTIIWQIGQPIIMPDRTLVWFILPLLFGGQIFSQSVIPWSSFLTRTAALLAQTISVFVAAVASLLLNTLLIPEYGPTGAAITFLAANMIYFALIYCAGQLQIRNSDR